MSKNRKRKREGEDQFQVDWGKEKIFSDEIINEMQSMWEIPQIFHFLHLARESLNIPHLSMYEMERMLLIPRASKQLANIMTSLLSSPMAKAKLRKVPPMPYEFWTNILAYKMKSWFKIYEAKHQDPVKVLEAIGVEPEFWSIFPDAPLLNGKDFEDLSFRRRVWLLKTVCDTVMHTRKTVQEDVMNQPWEDQFETVLGTDRYGARYIYFPQFLKNDLRIYRHSLDNNVLSTVKPIKQKLKTEPQSKALDQVDLLRKKARYRKRKWCKGKTPKPKKRASKCNSDSATSSVIVNEDTNLSSASVCSSNNSNNIITDTVIDERSRSLSKSSTRSTESEKRHYKCTSGYDSSSSVCAISGKRESQKMFKGFSDSCDSKCKIKIIHGLLDDIKRDTSEEKDLRDVDVTPSHASKKPLELTDTKSQYLDETSLSTKNNDPTVNNLAGSSSKTDDEKLNEIFSAENFKLNDKDLDNDVKDTRQISSRLKSDDERLNETRTVDREEDERLVAKQELDEGNETDSFDEVSLNELRSILQKEAMDDDSSFDEDSEFKYNCSNVKDQKRRKAKDFNDMLMELSSSKFKLVADSVSSLRKQIAILEKRNLNSVRDADSEPELVPANETKLLERLKELLASLEEMEPVLRESAKKARAKLHKEWINYNEGAEDQDSSGEGLGSNWWVLGSQGCLLPASGDALQTLPHPTLSATSSEKVYGRTESEACNERSRDDKPCDGERKQSQNESLENGSQEEQCERVEGSDKKNTRSKEETTEEAGNDEQQTRRVLRTRGISSYTEQLFYSDEESEENELERWTEVEAVYAASDPYADTSSTHPAAKDRLSENWSNEEDSDKDWILPGSRKRKNKRPSTARRLKAFKQKLQNITTNVNQNEVESNVKSADAEREKPIVTEIRICRPKNCDATKVGSSNSSKNRASSVQEIVQSIVENTVQDTVQTNTEDAVQNTVRYTEQNQEVAQGDQKAVPSTEETIMCVQSELDIKDEGPIYDSPACHFDPNYTATFNPNYVNYYVIEPTAAAVMPQAAIVQAGPVVSNIVQPIQQGYYVQDQNYIIQSPQPGFVGPQPFEPQPQMIQPQQFVNPTGFIPYMIAQPQPEYITTNHQTIPPSLPPNYNFQFRPNPAPISKPPKLKKYVLVKENQPGSVVRYNPTVKENGPRTNNAKNVVQQANVPAKVQKSKESNTSAGNTGQKTTSLIVLSDSDDEIEMISTETTTPSKPANSAPLKYIVPAPRKNAIPQQIIQRMNQGGISITPIKPPPPPPPPPVQNATTQLVVVLNESGSHYALALPNGSKLILTPEQVAQIRASNGGKLIL